MAKPIWERKPERMLSTEARNWLAELQEEWNVLQEKAEKLDATETLMREQPYITVTPRGQYSIRPVSNAERLVKAIMAILFPDEPEILEAAD